LATPAPRFVSGDRLALLSENVPVSQGEKTKDARAGIAAGAFPDESALLDAQQAMISRFETMARIAGAFSWART
jgi:hypothetical protein